MSLKIAIVGAGAMGVLTGFHLHASGAEVTYVVRPARAAAMPSTYRLYSYDDDTLVDFSDFLVISEASKLTEMTYHFVIITLDGNALSSKEGAALLHSIGEAIRKTDAILIVGSIGVQLRERALKYTALPEERVIYGALGLMAHEVKDVSIPAHPPTDDAKRAQADFAFRRIHGGGFVLEDRNKEAATRFAELFDKSGLAKCFVVPVEQFAIMMRDIFPVFIAAEIAGWPDAEGLIEQKELWSLTTEAVRAIRGLNEHGETGRKAAEDLTEEHLAQAWRGFEAAAKPLDFAAFNAYHHGTKIKASDLLLLNEFISKGKDEGRDTRAIEELLQRLILSQKKQNPV